MNIKNLLILLTLVFASNIFAQNTDFFKAKDVVKYRFDRLEISNEKEAEWFLKNYKKVDFIEAIKIGNVSNITEILNTVPEIGTLKELNIKDYKGIFTAETFKKCNEIIQVSITIDEENLSQILFLNEIKTMQILYLFIKGKPENIEPIKKLKPLQELHIIGDFLPKKIEEIIDAVNFQPFIQTFGISVDRVTDLPINIKYLRTLSNLIIYDNLSIAANNSIEDLVKENITISYLMGNDLIFYVPITYYSNYDKLASFEIDYLKSIYSGKSFNNLIAEETETKTDKKNIIEFKTQFKPTFNSTKEFLAPYPSIVPEAEYFEINPMVNNVILTNNGSKITIPANSFVFEKIEGEVTDNVYLKYTKTNTPLELVFSGLNLNTNTHSFSNKYFFNLQATTSKNNVQLKPGYQLKLQLPINKDSASNYFFDYESNTWQPTDLYQQVFESSFVPIDFYKIENDNSSVTSINVDTFSFNSRFYSRFHYFLNDKDNANQIIFKEKNHYIDLDRFWKKDYNKDGKKKGIRIKKGKSLVKLQKVIPKVRNANFYYFKLIDKTQLGLITELSAFKNIVFSHEIDPENKKAFLNDYIKNNQFYDIRVNYNLGDIFCTLLLKTNEGFNEIKVRITDSENEKTKRKQIIHFAKSYKKYQSILKEREYSFNLNTQKIKTEYIDYLKEKNILNIKNNLKNETKIHQLGSFGIFYSIEPKFDINLIAQFTNESGIPIDVKYLYMIDKRYNSYFELKPGNILFSPTECQYFIAVDYSGKLYYATQNDLNISNLTNNSLTYIKLKLLRDNISTIESFIKTTR